MLRYAGGEMERWIAETRRQKERIEELVSVLEARSRYEEEDVDYFDGVLEGVEKDLRRLRRSVGHGIRFR